MTTTLTGVHGPIDFVLIEFPEEGLTGRAADALLDLVESGVVRIYDLVIVYKHRDDSWEMLEIADAAKAAAFARFTGARSGLLAEEDVEEAASAMKPGTLAALIVYENSWAIPFVGAVRDSGGELIASSRIPAPDVMAALEALESNA